MLLLLLMPELGTHTTWSTRPEFCCCCCCCSSCWPTRGDTFRIPFFSFPFDCTHTWPHAHKRPSPCLVVFLQSLLSCLPLLFTDNCTISLNWVSYKLCFCCAVQALKTEEKRSKTHLETRQGILAILLSQLSRRERQWRPNDLPFSVVQTQKRRERVGFIKWSPWWI